MLVRSASCAKTAELIEMPFEVLTSRGPGNHALVQIPHRNGQLHVPWKLDNECQFNIVTGQ